MRQSYPIVIVLLIMGMGCKERPNAAVKKEAERQDNEKLNADSQKPKTEQSDKPNSAPRKRLKGCTTANVQAAVRPHRPDIIRCYRKLLSTQPRATGRLSVEIHIDISGRSKFLGVQTNTFNDEGFAACIFDVLRPLDYPVPDSEPCVVVYPFSFQK